MRWPAGTEPLPAFPVDPDCAEELSHRLTREQLAALIDTVEDLQHARVYNMNEALFLTLMCSRLRQAAGK